MTEMFSEHYLIYQKIKYISSIILLTALGVLGLSADNSPVIISVFIMFVLYILNELMARFDNKFKPSQIAIIGYVELIIYNILDYSFSTNVLTMSLWTVLIISAGMTFIINATEFDKSTIFARKILFFFPLVLKLLFSFSKITEAEWFCYLFIQIIVSAIVFSVIDSFVHLNDTYEGIKRKLTIEKSNIESNNEKLIDYQEKVKNINEQINYQKIDLERAIHELEQVNIEIESQTEIMKYMASTFDILKCMNIITDTIMEVKKAKLCVMYIDKDVYQNKESSFIIKTNYTSMQRRLKKDIVDIFNNYSKMSDDSCKILKYDLLNNFRFIGDANINSLAILPIKDKKKVYGIMIVGSDNIDFFDKGTNYYENCIMEFGATIKSTTLYLQMEDMARKDGLTGIYNRVYNTNLFKKVAKESLSKNKSLTVALFDIDKFKNVNDTYGHLAGDEVIKMVANVAKKYADKYNGFACRFGGEEFLLTLPDYGETEAIDILEAMHNELKSTVVRIDDMEISINVCIGVSSYPGICSDPNALVSRADKAMYYGKKHGRGRLVLDNPEIDTE